MGVWWRAMDPFDIYTAAVPYAFAVSLVSLAVGFWFLFVKFLGTPWGLVIGLIPSVVGAWFLSFVVAMIWPAALLIPVVLVLQHTRKRVGPIIIDATRTKGATYRRL